MAVGGDAARHDVTRRVEDAPWVITSHDHVIKRLSELVKKNIE